MQGTQRSHLNQKERVTQLPPSPGPVDPLHLPLTGRKSIPFSPLTLSLFLHLTASLDLVSRDAKDLPPSCPHFYTALPVPYIKNWLTQASPEGKQPPPHACLSLAPPHLHIWTRSHNWRSLAGSVHPRTSWECRTGRSLCVKGSLKIRLGSGRELPFLPYPTMNPWHGPRPKLWGTGRSSRQELVPQNPDPGLLVGGKRHVGRGQGPEVRTRRISSAHGGLSTNAHFSLLMASSAFLPLKLGEDRRSVAPCSTHTIVPPTEPRQWYRGQGRTNRNSSGV